MESALNYYCKIKKLPHKIIELKGLRLLSKEKKWGLIRGFAERMAETWQIVKVRIELIKNKKYL